MVTKRNRNFISDRDQVYVGTHIGHSRLLILSLLFVFCCSCSVSSVQLFVTPWIAGMPGYPVLHCFLKLAQTNCPLSQWYDLTISSSVIPSSSCLQSFPVIGSNESSPTFESGGQNTGASASTSVLQMNIQGWFPLGLTGLMSLQSKGLFKSFLHHHSSNASFLWHSAFFMVQLSHPYMTTGKTIALTVQTFVGKVMSLLFNTLFRFVIAFLPRNKCLLISWLQSPSTLILKPKKIISVTASTFKT